MTQHLRLFRQGVPISAAAFLLWTSAVPASSFTRPSADLFSVSRVRCETCRSSRSHSPLLAKRSFSTWADGYFAEHKQIPVPKEKHTVLSGEAPNGILVVGDVHGCYEELLKLHQKAREQVNGGKEFSHVILVGDLCNKGPMSTKVIQHVQMTPSWCSVRGNHDDGALAAALGDASRREKKAYAWVLSEEEEDSLTDQDVLWMVQVPYTLRIPGEVLGEEEDTLIVHAGLVPGVTLEEQSIEDMVTIREVVLSLDGTYRAAGKGDKEKRPWASLWNSDRGFRVIFGHDARRGLQRHNEDWAVGLDTGACYGKELTGIVLSPSAAGCKRTLVSVPAADVYSPIGSG